jgi:predicted DNA-binding transcriptional regulator AlpA
MIYTTKKAAEYLGISERTVHRLIQEGVFPAPVEEFKMDQKKTMRYWREEDLEKYRSQLRPRGRPSEK